MDRQVTVRMSERLFERLERRATRERRKRSDVIRLALESGIPDLGTNHREHLQARGSIH